MLLQPPFTLNLSKPFNPYISNFANAKPFIITIMLLRWFGIYHLFEHSNLKP